MPKKVTGEARRDSQLLLRITREELAVLEAASHLRGCTPNAYAHDLLTAHIQALRTDTFILRDLENRRAFAEANATVTKIGASGDVVQVDSVAGRTP